MKEFFLAVVFLCAAVAIPMALIVIPGNWYVAMQCANYEKITGKPTKYAQFDSCYIKTAQGWQRWDEYKTRIIASESKALQ